MKFWNLESHTDQEEGGEEVLDVSIFGDIDPGFFADGIASKAIAEELKAHAGAKRIHVKINSVGGDAFGGIAIHNLLRGHGGYVHVTVDGIAASAASVIAMAGHKVTMATGAMLMVHNPWTVTAGEADDLRATADVLDKLRDGLVAIYQAKTGKKPAELRALLSAETWMTAEEAKAAGFADEIAGKPVKAKAESETVILNSIAFPRAKLPGTLLVEAALGQLQAIAVVSDAPGPLAAGSVLAIDRATIPPALLASLLAEGHAAGVAAERARLRAIDELDMPGHADLVADAKYGEKPIEAPELAVQIVRATKRAGVDLLAARRRESNPAAAVGGNDPGASRHTSEADAAKQIAAFANARRGGPR